MAIVRIYDYNGFPVNFRVAGEEPTNQESLWITNYLDERQRGYGLPLPGDTGAPGFGAAFSQGLSSSLQSIQAGMHNLIGGGLGGLFNSPSLKQWGEEGYERNMAQAAEAMPDPINFNQASETGQWGRFLGQVLGGSAPYIAATALGGFGGVGLAGAGASAAVRTLAGIAGATTAVTPLFAGENLNRQMAESGEITNYGGAWAAAIPQALTESLVNRLLLGLGRTVSGTPIVSRVLTSPGFKSRVAGVIGRVGEGVVAEAPAEVSQQMLERLQAGLELFSDDAIEEYREAALSAAVAGGSIAGTRGLYDAATARGRIAREAKRKAEEIARDSADLDIVGLPPRKPLPQPAPLQITYQSGIAGLLEPPETIYGDGFTARTDHTVTPDKVDITFRQERDAPTETLPGNPQAIPIPRGEREANLSVPIKALNPITKAQVVLNRLKLGVDPDANVSYQELLEVSKDQANKALSKYQPLYRPIAPAKDPAVVEDAKFERDYKTAIELARAKGSFSVPEVRKATGLPLADIRALRERAVARGDLVKGAEKYFPSDQISARKHPTAEEIAKLEQTNPLETLAPGAVANEAAPAKGDTTLQPGEAVIDYVVEARRTGKPGESDEAFLRSEKQRRDKGLPPRKPVYTVVQRSRDRQGTLLGKNPLRSFASEVEAEAERARLAGDKPTSPQGRPVTLQGKEQPASPVANAVPRKNLEGRYNHIAARQIYHALRKHLNNLGFEDFGLRLQEAIEAPVQADGKKKYVEGVHAGKLITLSYGIYRPDMTTEQLIEKLSEVLNHEIIHALKESGAIGEKHFARLEHFIRNKKRVLKGKQRSYTYYEWAKANYEGVKGYTEEGIIEEAIAEAFRDWAQNKKIATPEVSGIFARIVDFFQKLGKFLTNTPEAEKFFDQILAGNVKPGSNLGSKVKFSLKNSRQPENKFSLDEYKPDELDQVPYYDGSYTPVIDTYSESLSGKTVYLFDKIAKKILVEKPTVSQAIWDILDPNHLDTGLDALARFIELSVWYYNQGQNYDISKSSINYNEKDGLHLVFVPMGKGNSSTPFKILLTPAAYQYHTSGGIYSVTGIDFLNGDKLKEEYLPKTEAEKWAGLLAGVTAKVNADIQAQYDALKEKAKITGSPSNIPNPVNMTPVEWAQALSKIEAAEKTDNLYSEIQNAKTKLPTTNWPLPKPPLTITISPHDIIQYKSVKLKTPDRLYPIEPVVDYTDKELTWEYDREYLVYSKSYFPKAFSSFEDFQNKYLAAPIVNMQETELSDLDNTSLGAVNALGVDDRLDQVRAAIGDRRDVESLIKGLRENRLPPAIALKDGKRIRLMSGNTRLMIAYALYKSFPIKIINVGKKIRYLDGLQRFANAPDNIIGFSSIFEDPNEFLEWWQGGWNPATNFKGANRDGYRAIQDFSRLANEDGTPRLWYNGSPETFTAFNTSGKGAFLTPSPAFAGVFSHYITIQSINKGEISEGFVNKNWLATASPSLKSVMVSAQKIFDPKSVQDIEDLLQESRGSDYKEHLRGMLQTAQADRADGIGQVGWIEVEEVAHLIRAAGYDSYYTYEGGLQNIAVLNSNQIKSAFNPFPTDERLSLKFSMRYSAKDLGHILPPPTDSMQRATYNSVATFLNSKFNKFVKDRNKQDKFADKVEGIIEFMQNARVSVERFVDYVAKNGGNLTDDNDPAGKAILASSRAGALIQNRYESNGPDGLYKIAADLILATKFNEQDKEYAAKINNAAFRFLNLKDYDGSPPTEPLFDLYVFARHAPFRNAEMKAREAQIVEKDEDGKITSITELGSGITNTEASQILDWFKKHKRYPELLKAENAFRDIIRDTNQFRKDTGLIPLDFDNGDSNLFAPLRGHPEEDIETDRAYISDAHLTHSGGLAQGFNTRGREDPRALGRSSLPSLIFKNAVFQNSETITRGSRNQAGDAFSKMLEDNTELTKHIAVIIKSAPVSRKMVNGKSRMVVDPKYKSDEDVLVFKRNGNEIAIRIFDPRIARAMRGTVMIPETTSWIIGKMLLLNRVLAMTRTTYNPEFPLSNFPKDFQNALVNVSQYELKGISKEISKNIRRAFSAARKDIRGLENDLGPDGLGVFFTEFKNSGGITAFQGIRTLEATSKKVDTLLKEMKTGPTAGAIRTFKKLGKWVEDYNTVLENTTRLAVFAALRKRGVSIQQASIIAKRSTVNFSEGGRGKNVLSAFYLFYNASVGGTFTIMEAGIRSKKVRKIMGGILVAGVLQDLFMSSLAPEDDEDGRNIYDDIPQWQLEHHMIFLDPLGLTERGYFSIPMPYGYSAIHNIGRALGKFFRGAADAGETTLSITAGIIDSFNPFGGTNSWANAVAPTIADPFIDIMQNKDFANRKISPDQNPFALPVPSSQLFWNSTSDIFRAPVEFLHTFTGGTPILPGTIELNAEHLQYWIEYFLGGVASFVRRGIDLTTETLPSAIQGDFEDISMNDIPFLRKFYGNITTQNNVESYLNDRDRVMLIDAEIEDAIKDGDPARLARVRAEYPEEVRIRAAVKTLDLARSRLSRQIRTIRENANLTPAQQSAAVRRLQDQQNELVGRANALMSNL